MGAYEGAWHVVELAADECALVRCSIFCSPRADQVSFNAGVSAYWVGVTGEVPAIQNTPLVLQLRCARGRVHCERWVGG